MDNPLITQSGLDEVGLLMDNLGADLEAHANGSLSDAHAINVIHFTELTRDHYGNDITHYTDSAGNLIGEYQVRFTIDNGIYYAPANLAPGLAAQAPIPASLSEAQSEELLNGRGSTALATQFRAEAVTNLQTIQTGVLLPHTRLGHWEAHAPVRAIPRVTLDSNGNVIGGYTLLWQFGGAKFEIPCSHLLGGPPEPPRGVVLVPSDIKLHFKEEEGYDDQVAITCTASGHRPFTFKWELKISDSSAGEGWGPLTNDDGSTAGVLTSYDGKLEIGGTATFPESGKSVFTITNLQTEEGKNQGQIRCTVINGIGASTGVVSIYATDETSCAMFTASCEAGYCGPKYLMEALRFQIKTHSKLHLARAQWGGYIVLGNWLGKLIKRRRWYSKAIFRFLVEPMHEGFASVNRARKMPLGTLLVCSLVRLACVLTYCLFRTRAEASIEFLGRYDLMELYGRKLRELRSRWAARQSR